VFVTKYMKKYIGCCSCTIIYFLVSNLKSRLIMTVTRGTTRLHFRGSNFHEISFDDVIVFIQPWHNFFANGHR